MLDIKDVKPPLDEPFPSWWIFLLVALVVAVCVYAVFYFFRRKSIAPAPVPLPPWEAADQRLEDLKTRGLLKSGQYQAYYTALSDIVRRYIEDRFQIRAPEMTTEEFMTSLKHSAVLNARQKEILKSFLMAADMVKFAKHVPDPRDAEEGFHLVKQLVDATTPSNDI